MQRTLRKQAELPRHNSTSKKLHDPARLRAFRLSTEGYFDQSTDLEFPTELVPLGSDDEPNTVQDSLGIKQAGE